MPSLQIVFIHWSTSVCACCIVIITRIFTNYTNYNTILFHFNERSPKFITRASFIPETAR